VPELNKIYESYKDKGLDLLSVNCGEAREDVQQTINNNGIKYAVLLDLEGKVAQTYKVQYIPLNILVDINGNIVYRDNPVPSEEMIDKYLDELKI